MSSRGYNGYANYETWNVCLWIGNDEDLYRAAYNYMKSKKGVGTYSGFLMAHGLYDNKTPDGVYWSDRKINLLEANRFIRELGSW